MEKILSVCIPTYNMEALLSRCLNSFIISHEYMSMLDVLIVNDGSTDGSSEIAHKYAKLYPDTFSVIDKANGNYGSCINTALKVARGKYFKICDADDWFENKHLINFIDFLMLAKADIIFSAYMKCYDDSTKNKLTEIPYDLINKQQNIDNIDWDSPSISHIRTMHCMATNTEILRKNNYTQTEGISYTDTEFVYYSCLYATSCSFFDNYIYCYYLGREGQTMSNTSIIRSYQNFYMVANKLLSNYTSLEPIFSKNKCHFLLSTILAPTIYFASVAIADIKNNDMELKQLKGMLSIAKKSKLICPIEDMLMQLNVFKMWRKYHIPSSILYLYRHHN